LDWQRVGSLAFEPAFDQTRGAGATIRRMADFLFAELQHADTLLTNEIAARSFEDNLVLSVLLALPNNYTDRLARRNAAAAPGNVKRAEAFIQANAGMPLTIAEIAEAADAGFAHCKLRFSASAASHPCRYCSRRDWNRREPKCCASARPNR